MAANVANWIKSKVGMDVQEGTEAMEVDQEEEKKAVVKVFGAKIGQNIICNLKVEVEGSKKKIKTSNRVAILILDCSGSMGNWVQRSVTAWQRALRAQQYGENDDVHMIEFESRTVSKKHQLKDLDKLRMTCRGGTTMSGVVDELEKLVAKYKRDKTINIWVVSDGQIGDQAQFKQGMTQKLAGHFDSANINVIGIRLSYGDNGAADVQAMSAVGLLSKQQFQLEDYRMNDSYYRGHGYEQNPTNPDEEELAKSLAVALGGMRAPEEQIVVSLQKKKLIVRPGEEAKKSLELWNADWFIIKEGEVDTAICVNEEPATIQFYPETENLSVLEQFATKVYLRLVQEKIAGLYDNAKFVEALEQLFFDLDKMSKTIEEDHETTHSEMSTTSRALQIKKKFGKQTKTLRQKIAELKNMVNMDKMTSTMQSNLLRGLGAGKGDTALLKRYGRTDQGKDPAQMMHDAIDKAKPALLELKMEKDQAEREECFFSKETCLESALVAIETGVEVYDEASDISADNLLTIFGLHGLAIKHKAGNYTDPMLIGLNQGLKDTIHEVYPNVILNQSILWYAKSMQTELKAPGFDKTITAVVPIKGWNHPAVWKLYCQDTDIAAMQTSAHLRNVLTPLPKDRVAFTASLLLKMMADWPNPTEVQGKMMCEVLLTIQWKTQNENSKKLADALKGDDPLAELSTTNNLASELAPFAQILCDQTLLEFLGTEGSQGLWRALVANTIYWTVRRAIGDGDRAEIIQKLLNYTSEHFTHPLADLEPEPEHLSIHDMWDEQKAKEYIRKNKYLYDHKLYRNLLALATAFKAAGNKTTPAVFKTSNNADIGGRVGMDIDLFCLVEIVKSIETKNETERYGEGSTGFHTTEQDARDYLKGILRGLYRRQYDTELQLKQARVKEAKLQYFLANFKGMSFDTFAIHLVENVPTQNSKGMPDMLAQLGEDKEKTVDLASKVELMLIGKFGENTWNNGSVNRNGAPVLLGLLEPLLAADRFTEIKDHVDRYSWHRYRDDPDNRQGHSNIRPSFWAATNYVDPWSFLKNDKASYRKFLKTLETLDGSEPTHQAIYDEWKHLLTTDPHKHDVNAGKIGQSGKEKRKMRKVDTDKIHEQRKRAKIEGNA